MTSVLPSSWMLSTPSTSEWKAERSKALWLLPLSTATILKRIGTKRLFFKLISEAGTAHREKMLSGLQHTGRHNVKDK